MQSGTNGQNNSNIYIIFKNSFRFRLWGENESKPMWYESANYVTREYRKRILEDKAKVVASVWGGKIFLIPCSASASVDMEK